MVWLKITGYLIVLEGSDFSSNHINRTCLPNMRSQNIGSDPLPGFYFGKMKHVFLRKFGYVQKHKNKKEHLFGSWYKPRTKPVTDDVVDKKVFTISIIYGCEEPK